MKILLNTSFLIALITSASAGNELDKALVTTIKESTQPKGDVNLVTHAEKESSTTSLPAAGEGVQDPNDLPKDGNIMDSAQVSNNPAKDELRKEEAIDDTRFGPLTSDGGEESYNKNALDRELYEHAAGLFQNANITSPAA